jgi:hypothetical protein
MENADEAPQSKEKNRKTQRNQEAMCHLLVNCIACELSGNLLQRNWTKNLGLVPPSTVE